MAGSRTSSAGRLNGKVSPRVPTRTGKVASIAAGAGESANTAATGMHDDEVPTPLGIADSLSRTASETCRQRDRRARLSKLGVPKWEVIAAEALVDTCDLALAECVVEFEKKCSKVSVADSSDIRQAASALWLAAREYLRRMSIAEKASRQLTQQHGADKFGDLHLEYELEASALLALKHSTETYIKFRPDAR